ncbi:MAG: hypothetical protein WCW13_01780 [archaeon]|jgi:hypothetical protein
MVLIHISPPWFFGYDIVFELIFAVVALALALFALRVSHLTSQRSAGLFGKGFLLISISYFFQSIFNFFMLAQIGDHLYTPFDAAMLPIIQQIGAYGHVLFMLTGLVVLLYTSFEIKNKRLFLAFLALAIVPLFIIDDLFGLFYVVSTVCLLFVAWYYVANYLKKKQSLNLVTALAFLLLLIGHAQYFLSINNPPLYVIGHAIELFGYLLILVNFYLVLRR